MPVYPYHHFLTQNPSINWAGWFQFGATVASVIVLAVTLNWLKKYTRATERMVENQMLPAVDVNMIFDKNNNNTYFWFSNASNIPALVSWRATVNRKNQGEKIYQDTYRIAPNNLPHYKRTASSFNFLEDDPPALAEATLKLDLSIVPAIDKAPGQITFTKSYVFNRGQFRWDETTWGWPDPEFPELKMR
ncbi:MAG: hypothetical protein CEN90_608 [Parcubacteria group bacterium Licking1014_17]|nr:MAG: hypothetical protein CEN90_608 [Parcubacteria group bacterium Licking1014_17]